jgi:hypothetical protein
LPKRFSDFAKEEAPLDGEKAKIEGVLNKELLVIGFKIRNSKYNTQKCLTLQYELNSKKYILFTGSSVLIEQIEKYQKEIPFLTVIKKIDKFYTFS